MFREIAAEAKSIARTIAKKIPASYKRNSVAAGSVL
jgi:hypothetical protein